MIEGKTFIGIGKILFDMPAEEWNIPHLHFIVSKAPEDVYEATNLEFGLVSIGTSGADAATGLASLTSSYIISVMRNGRGYEEFREIARKDFMSDFWAEYRGMEFDLAQRGDDLSHSFDRHITKAIQETFCDEFKEALTRGAGEMADELIHRFLFRPPVVEYKELRKAA
jgi:hypothetical protein